MESRTAALEVRSSLSHAFVRKAIRSPMRSRYVKNFDKFSLRGEILSLSSAIYTAIVSIMNQRHRGKIS